MASRISMAIVIWLLLSNITLTVVVNSLNLPTINQSRKNYDITSHVLKNFDDKSEPTIFNPVTDRRGLLNLPTKTCFGYILSCCFLSKPASGAYGDNSNMSLPSYIDFLIEKNTKIDPSLFLYQGADRDLQIQRIALAVSKLETIPDIAKSKKWSQVQGVITGPLGTLIATMNSIAAGGSSTSKESQKIVAKVKVDLFAIGQCAIAKNESACIAATEATLKDMNDFVKVAF